MKANTCAPDLSIPVNIRYTESCDKFINNFTGDIFDSPGFWTSVIHQNQFFEVLKRTKY